MLGLTWLDMHLWLNLINGTISNKNIILKIVKIYVQSQWRVFNLLYYHIFWQSSIQRGRHTKLCIISSLKRIIPICKKKKKKSKLHAFYYIWSQIPIHIQQLFGETSLLKLYAYTINKWYELLSNITVWIRLRCIAITFTLNSAKVAYIRCRDP